MAHVTVEVTLPRQGSRHADMTPAELLMSTPVRHAIQRTSGHQVTDHELAEAMYGVAPAADDRTSREMFEHQQGLLGPS